VLAAMYSDAQKCPEAGEHCFSIYMAREFMGAMFGQRLGRVVNLAQFVVEFE